MSSSAAAATANMASAPLSAVALSVPAPISAPAKLPDLPTQYHFLAGGIAGVTEIVTMYPLDVVKTRFQLQVSPTAAARAVAGAAASTAAPAYSSVADCFMQIIRNEGPRTLYRGLIPPVMVESPRRAIKFAAYEHFTQMYRGLLNVKETTRPISVLAGASGGLVEGALVVSFELVKIRLQDKANAGKYSGTMDAVRKIYRAEGARTFIKGYEACAWRHGLWNVGYFSVIKTVRDSLPTAKTKKASLLTAFVAGTIGGTAGTLLNTPSDVVKTRIQSQAPGVSKYRWTIPSAIKIAQEEGIAALYKGFVPKVMRLGPGGGILLVVFDWAAGMIRTHLM